MNINKLFRCFIFYSRCFFLTKKHKIRNSAKSTLCEYVAVVHTSLFCTTYTYIQQDTRFCVKKQSFKMFTDIFPTVYIEAQK